MNIKYNPLLKHGFEEVGNTPPVGGDVVISLKKYLREVQESGILFTQKTDTEEYLNVSLNIHRDIALIFIGGQIRVLKDFTLSGSGINIGYINFREPQIKAQRLVSFNLELIRNESIMYLPVSLHPWSRFTIAPLKPTIPFNFIANDIIRFNTIAYYRDNIE